MSAVARIGICVAAIACSGAAALAGDPFYGRTVVSHPDEELVLFEPAPPVYPDYRRGTRYAPIAVINHGGVAFNQPFPAARAHYWGEVISARY